MKMHSLFIIALATVLTGCVEEHPIVYNKPLTSPGGIYSKLPPTVQNSVRAQAGTAEISNLARDDSTGSPIYIFYFKNPELFPPLYVASDGSVLTSNLTVAVGASPETIEAATGSGVSGLRMGDLPPNVVETIRHSAPTSVVSTISRLTSEGDIFYEVTFEDPSTHPSLIVRDDGHVLH